MRLVFPRAKIFGSFAHRARQIWKMSKSIKCGVLGVKTAALAKPVNLMLAYILTISMLPQDRCYEEFEKLKLTFNGENFREFLQ
jgi:hypothetical protein